MFHFFPMRNSRTLSIKITSLLSTVLRSEFFFLTRLDLCENIFVYILVNDNEARVQLLMSTLFIFIFTKNKEEPERDYDHFVVKLFSSAFIS